MYRRAPAGRETEFKRAAKAYERLCGFCRSAQGVAFVTRYRFSPERASSLGLEVRKDLLVELEGREGPVGVKWENVARIGDTLARALYIYLTEDRAEREASVAHELGRHDPWYRPQEGR